MRRVAVAVLLLATVAHATTYTVAPSGGDFTQIQTALDVAIAGDTVVVRQGPSPYFETLVFPRSGDDVAGFITLTAFPGERPVLDATGVADADVIRLEDRSWVRVIGFEIRNLLDVRDGSGIRVVHATPAKRNDATQFRDAD
jgi:hypothetical protein